MRFLIIVLLVLLPLAGAGTAAVMLHVGPADKLVAMVKKMMESPPPPPPPAPVTKNVGSFVIPLIDHRNIQTQVGMDVAISINATSATNVGKEMAAIQNGFFLELYDLVPKLVDPKSDESKATIHDHLMKVAAKQAGEGAIVDVILKSVYVR